MANKAFAVLFVNIAEKNLPCFISRFIKSSSNNYINVTGVLQFAFAVLFVNIAVKNLPCFISRFIKK